MTIAKTGSSASYVGNGVTVAFSFPFRFFDDTDLKVYIVAADGTSTLQTLTTDYSVSNAGDETGGTVTMVTAPASTETLLIEREVPETQSVDYQNNDAFPAETHEQALDRLTLLVQQQSRGDGLHLTFPTGDTNSPILPTSSLRANKLLGFGTGGAIETFDSTTGIIDTEFDTVADLLASTKSFDVGVYVHVKDGDFTYKVVASGGDVQNSATTPVEFDALVKVPNLGFCYEQFGAIGDGTTDDTTAMQACVTRAKSDEVGIFGKPGSRYLITDANGIWLGSDDTANTVRGYQSNNSTIVIGVSGGIGVDLTGIQNGKRDEYDIRIETDSGITAANAVIQARPKQGAGVVSSGNAGKLKVWFSGASYGPGYYNVQSESNVQQSSFVNNSEGLAYAWCKDDWFDGKAVATLTTSVAGSYTIGETITGGTSGATGTLLRADDTRLFIDVTSGTFATGEVLTGGTSGQTGTTASTPFVFGPASPNSTLGVETGSTSTLQAIKDIWANNGSSDKLWPVALIRSFSDLHFEGLNFNTADQGDLLEIHGDTSPRISFGYFHATHRYSILFGDLADVSSQVVERGHFTALNAGVPTARIKTATDLVRFEDCFFDMDGDLDFGGSDLNGDNRIKLGAFSLTASGRVEGSITYDSNDGADLSGYTSAASDKRASLFDISTGISAQRREVSETISSGAINASGPIIRVFGESAAADDLTHMNLPTGLVPDGATVYLQLGSASQPITIKPGVGGGNFRTADNARVLMKADILYPFVYDARQDEWSYAGLPNANPDQTGFTAITGTSDKGTFATSTATTQDVAEKLMAIEAALITCGVIST